MSRNDTDYIVIHCTAGPQSQTIESIKEYWRSKGWQQVGYHRIIKPNGEVVQLADDWAITNGVRGYNSRAYHICWIGGMDGDNRTTEQKVALVREIERACKLFPAADVCGHRDLSDDLDGDGEVEPHEWVKLCPQFDVKEFMEDTYALKQLGNKILRKYFG